MAFNHSEPFQSISPTSSPDLSDHDELPFIMSPLSTNGSIESESQQSNRSSSQENNSSILRPESESYSSGLSTFYEESYFSVNN